MSDSIFNPIDPYCEKVYIFSAIAGFDDLRRAGAELAGHIGCGRED